MDGADFILCKLYAIYAISIIKRFSDVILFDCFTSRLELLFVYR